MTNIITKKEWISIFPEARPYLEEQLDYQIKRFDILKAIYENDLDIIRLKKLKGDDKDFAETMVDVWDGEDLKECEKKVKEIYWYIRKDNPSWLITSDDIERAKAYPCDGLVKFNKSGFALCPFHKDTDASFHWNKTKNTMHCFSCNKTWDTIQFVRETNSCDFKTAVKSLK